MRWMTKWHAKWSRFDSNAREEKLTEKGLHFQFTNNAALIAFSLPSLTPLRPGSWSPSTASSTWGHSSVPPLTRSWLVSWTRSFPSWSLWTPPPAAVGAAFPPTWVWFITGFPLLWLLMILIPLSMFMACSLVTTLLHTITPIILLCFELLSIRSPHEEQPLGTRLVICIEIWSRTSNDCFYDYSLAGTDKTCVPWESMPALSIMLTRSVDLLWIIPQESFNVLDCGIYRVISRRGSQSEEETGSLINQSASEEERLKEFALGPEEDPVDHGKLSQMFLFSNVQKLPNCQNVKVKLWGGKRPDYILALTDLLDQDVIIQSRISNSNVIEWISFLPQTI